MKRSDTEKSSPACPGCRRHEVTEGWNTGCSPVVLNYRFDSRDEALRIPQKPVILAQCEHCGLVFNSAFDPGATPYDERYENTQNCSEAFQNHLLAICEHLQGRYDFAAGRIVEVGCGKGGFLKLLCAKTGAPGIGYDTSYEGEVTAADRSIQFHSRYLEAGELSERAALIVCRHVVEHVPDIAVFFEFLFQVSRDCGGAAVYIETPDWEWIVANDAHWDIFYEHCNYFSKSALANVARLAGFEVTEQRNLFGDQYQSIEIVPAASAGAELSPVTTGFDAIAARLESSRASVEQRVESEFAGKNWAIWGAGAKGVCLANLISAGAPQFLIDANPAKQGCFVAGAGLEVVSPADPRLAQLDAIVVMNPNYLSEIAASLDDRKISCRLVAIQ